MTDTESSSSGLPAGISNDKLLLGFAVFIHILFFLSLRIGFLNPLFDDATHRRGQGVDFFAVYQGGRNVLDGVSVYAEKPETFVVPYNYPYRYHPFTAYTFGLLFNVVTPALAYTVWMLLQELLLLLNIVITRRLFDKTSDANCITAVWLLFFPYYLELYMGQFSFLMASLILWALLAWMKERWQAGDSSWVFSLMVKSNSALFIPVLLKLKRWKPLIAGVVFVGLASLPYFLLVPGSLDAFTLNVSEGLKVPGLAGNQGFAALLGVVVLRGSGAWPGSIFEITDQLETLNAALPVPLLLWTIAILAVMIYLTIITPRRYWIELCILWLLAYFLFYKHVWEHQYVMMLPVFVLLFWLQTSLRDTVKIPITLLWSVLTVVAMPTAFIFIDKEQVFADPEYYWSTAESLLFHAPKPLAALTLFIVLAAGLWKKRLASDQPVSSS